MVLVFGFDIPIWVFIVIGLIYAAYKYLTWHFNTFTELGMRGPRPLPAVGTMLGMLRKGICQDSKENMNKYGKVYGLFMGRKPNLVVNDLDIVKEIFVKQFHNFQNRDGIKMNDYVMDNMLINLTDDQWKYVRRLMTPAFSTGRLRRMCFHIDNCGKTLVRNLETKTNEVIDFQPIARSYAMDVIAGTAFGLRVDSQTDPSNMFMKMANRISDRSSFSPALLIFIFLPFLVPYMKKLGITFFPKDTTDFFLDITKRAIETRKDSEEERTDFLQLMINACIDEPLPEQLDKEESRHLEEDKEGNTWKKKPLEEADVMAQCFLFFLAGFETVSLGLSFLWYNLACYPECQERLYQEIQDTLNATDNLTYDVVNKMPYLEMCFEESLRMYPPGPIVNRVCQADTNIHGLMIPKDMVVMINVYMIQNDPEVWPEPDTFRPERFTAEEKEQRDPMSWLPFGMGPRQCIAVRLAQVEVKMATVHLLRKFRLKTCEKTQIPIKLQKLQMKGTDGINLKLEKRD